MEEIVRSAEIVNLEERIDEIDALLLKMGERLMEHETQINALAGNQSQIAVLLDRCANEVKMIYEKLLEAKLDGRKLYRN